MQLTVMKARLQPSLSVSHISLCHLVLSPLISSDSHIPALHLLPLHIPPLHLLPLHSTTPPSSSLAYPTPPPSSLALYHPSTSSMLILSNPCPTPPLISGKFIDACYEADPSADTPLPAELRGTRKHANTRTLRPFVTTQRQHVAAMRYYPLIKYPLLRFQSRLVCHCSPHTSLCD